MDLPDYINDMPITIADEEFLEPHLKHWNLLNEYLQKDASTDSVVKLLKLELLSKSPRLGLINRLHSKLCRRKTNEERDSINEWVSWKLKQRQNP